HRPAQTLCSLSAAFAVLLFSACAQREKGASESHADETIVSTTPPFQTKEPERYRAVRTITTVSTTGQTVVTKNSMARDGELRRDEYDEGSQRVVLLTLAEGRFVLLPGEKLFANVADNEPAAHMDDEEFDSSPDRLLHTEHIAT